LTAVELGVLIRGMRINRVKGDMKIDIKGLAYDSRRVSSGDLFFALRGVHADGRAYAAEAVGKGASALVCEGACPEDVPVPSVCVDDAREALAFVSNRFHDNPSEGLAVTGITGTNGKTTTAFIVKSILESAGNKVGLIGTVSYMIGEKKYPAPYTTPEAPEFQGLLREMLSAGCSQVVTEVSSHALAQRRADHTRFGAAVFTNLTREHLDYHNGMEDYFNAKKRLFDELLSGPAVINADDPYGKRLASSVGDKLTYGIGNGADLMARNIENSLGGLSFRLASGGVEHPVESRLIGTINVYNILAAAGAAVALGMPWGAILTGIKGVGQVEGRFQKLEFGQDFLLVVDYAHTEDALMRLIISAREVTKGRVITVFGCGGDRDRTKRPAMGSAATELSDLVFITSDNPRSERPEDIIKEIVAGAKADNYRVVPDRAEAIRLAVREARPLDTVLIAGKGHEDYQIVKDRRLRFSDTEQAEKTVGEVLNHRGGGRV
jgi:UDP-N-acetylmuramoyl-L-alanyl-D-glutamate--2,6-diaminopimelate ligase